MNAIRFISYPLIATWLVLGVFAAIPAITGLIDGWKDYLWFAAGALLYLGLRQLKFFGKNESWMQVFSHELSHTAVSLLFLHKIDSFTASSRRGKVSYRGSNVGDLFISLAPYCLPLATYILLLLRLLSTQESMYIYDILIGFTASFYICSFVAQTGTHQSDITDQGTVRAFMFIVAAWIFNATIVLLSMRGGLWGALKFIAHQYGQSLEKAWHAISAMLMS
ncbi:MAG: hypothetical protein K2L96_03420 [Muribaculaceae bacterium]|nr:hypothetical protein [Muribaculaceae bacterium]